MRTFAIFAILALLSISCLAVPKMGGWSEDDASIDEGATDMKSIQIRTAVSTCMDQIAEDEMLFAGEEEEEEENNEEEGGEFDVKGFTLDSIDSVKHQVVAGLKY